MGRGDGMRELIEDFIYVLLTIVGLTVMLSVFKDKADNKTHKQEVRR